MLILVMMILGRKREKSLCVKESMLKEQQKKGRRRKHTKIINENTDSNFSAMAENTYNGPGSNVFIDGSLESMYAGI